MPFSRRGFLKAATLSAIAESEMYLGVIALRADTLSAAPHLENGDGSRGSDYISVAWDAADGVNFDLRIDSIAGSDIRKGLRPPARLNGLVPNRNYSILVTPTGSARWSAPFMVCTRPPAPGPIRAYQNMLDSNIVMRWDFATLASVADNPDAITLSIGSIDTSGTVIKIKRLLPLTGSITASDPIEHVARLASPNTLAPDNENVSEWGPRSILQLASFGLLKTPGPGLFLDHRHTYHLTRFRA